LDVHLEDHHAVSWNNHTLLDLNNITDNEIFVWNSFGGSVLASENCASLLLLELQDFQILLFFGVVTKGFNKGSKGNGEVN
jgi:hypothetical protein